MLGKRAVLILHPLNAADALPHRTLTFTSDSDYVEIGRASKREAKNLTPTDKNGLFDSRVMSRNHARLRACLDENAIYISDGGSMHGTWVNGKKLALGEDTIVNTGDMIVFGTEVARGRDMFPPLKVRCECRWHESEEKPAPNGNVNSSKLTTNTFCVPDDDENDVEITVDSAPVKFGVDSSSDSGRGSEDGSVVELSSPLTSPYKITDVEMCGSQQAPIELDNEQTGQPLVTPRMTPSSNEGAPGVIRRSLRSPIGDDDSNAGSVLSSQGDLASQSNNDQALSEDESMSNSSYESDIELSDDDEVSEKPNSASFPEAQKLAEVDAIKYTKETSCPGPDDKESHPIKAPVKSTELPPNNSMGNDITGLPGLRHSGIGVNPRDILEPEVGMAETYRQIVNSGWPSTFYGSYNSFDPLLGRAKPFDHSLTGFHSNKQSQENEEWRTSQGISNSSCIPMTNGHSRGSFLDEVCRPCVSYNDGPFVNAMLPRNVARDGTSSGHGMGINGATPATTENSAIPDYSASEERNIHPRPDTRLRIADIVSYPPPALQRSQRKRKAADMDNDQLLDDNNAAQNAYKFNPTSFKENKCVGSDNDDTCLPDAQPQAGVETMEDSYSQPTALSAANESQTVETKSHSSTENERQVKRQKKYDTVTVGSHATTAVLGAVIGAVGTVALLASLPSDYFL